jgi:hypothetical protein
VEIGLPRGIVACLRGLACVEASRGELVRAARLLGRADRLSAETGVVLPEIELVQRAENKVRQALGEPLFQQELGRGGSLALEEILIPGVA